MVVIASAVVIDHLKFVQLSRDWQSTYEFWIYKTARIGQRERECAHWTYVIIVRKNKYMY